MDEQTELLREAVALLRLIAEPQIAKRDGELRASLYELVGTSASRANSVKMMDGSKSQAEIRKSAAIDQGGLSRLTKALREAGIISEDDKPKLLIALPPNFPKRAE